jgi:hypothetical protein
MKLHSLFIGFTLTAILVSGGCSGASVATEAEAPIPQDYATYTAEEGVFSVSYPPEWQPMQEMLADLEAAAKEYIASQVSGVPVEQASLLFVGGLPPNYMPSIAVVVEPLPESILTHQQLVEAEINSLKAAAPDYKEIARLSTYMGGTQATLLEYKATFSEVAVHNVAAFIMKDGMAWSVTCTALSQDFASYKDELYSVARSLRVADANS